MDEVGGEEDGDDEGKKDCSGYDSLAHIITYCLCIRDKKQQKIKALTVNFFIGHLVYQFGQRES